MLAANRAPSDGGVIGRPLGGRMTQEAVVFALGALSALQIANVTVTLFSVVCLVIAPAYLLKTHRGADLLPLALAALGWLSFLASCVVNDVSGLWPNAIAPAAFGLYLMGLTVLTGGSLSLIAAALGGLAVGTVGFFATQGIELTNTGSFLDFWKYGVAHAATVLVVIASIMIGRRPFIQTGALLLLGVGNLVMNFRSLGLICLLSAALLLARDVLGKRVGRGGQFALVIGVGTAMATFLPDVARLGALGPALQAKIVLQDSTHLPFLLAARTEPPFTIVALYDRPLLGWGSAMNLTADVYARAQHLAVNWFGFDPNFPFEKYWRLPAKDYSGFHSILFASWGEGGILAALLPLWLVFACGALIWNFRRYGKWCPLVILMGLQGLWDLFYAPWTYNVIPEYACITLLFCARHFKRAGADHDS